MPGVRDHPQHARGRRRRRRRRPAAASGPRRTTSSRLSSTRTGRPCSSASARAASPTSECELAAEGAAVGQRGVRLAAGLAPRRVGLEVGGLDPASCAASPPSRPAGARAGASASTVVRRPCTLPATARASASVVPDRPAAGAVGHRDQRVGGRGVVAEAALAEGDLGRHRAAGRRSRARPGRVAASRSRAAIGAAAAARGPTRRGSCATRCSGTGGRAAPAPPRRGRRRAAWRAALRGGTRCPACRSRTGWRRWRRTRRPTGPGRRRRARRRW